MANLALIVFSLVHVSFVTVTTTSTNKTTTTPTTTCTYTTSVKYQILTLFAVLVFVTGVLGNLLVILTIQYSATLRKQSGYLILTSLAVADLGVSFFVTTFKIDMYLKNGSW